MSQVTCIQPGQPAYASGAPRTGILTIHYVSNYGAILQSLATARLFDAEIIDHRYRSKIRQYENIGLTRQHLVDYVDDSLPLSTKRVFAHDWDHRATLDFIESNQYELIVVGSDEVWKTNYSPPHPRRSLALSLARDPLRAWPRYRWLQVNPWYTPFPNIYWPETTVPCVGFAGSIGSTLVETIPPRHRREMARRLGNFSLIGVRDERTLEFVRQLAGVSSDLVELVPDPVFTFSASESDYEEAKVALTDCGVNVEQPFAFLDIRAARKDEYAREVADSGLPAVDLTQLALTPPQWFAAIGLAHVGVTDAMHPFISALVQDTPCLSIDKRAKSVELRAHFDLSKYGSLKSILANWPSAIPEKSAECAACVRRFVRKAQSRARRVA